jgi:hypothetical protein
MPINHIVPVVEFMCVKTYRVAAYSAAKADRIIIKRTRIIWAMRPFQF